MASGGPKLKTHWVAIWVNADGYRVRFNNESRQGRAVKLDADEIGSTDAYGGGWVVRFDAKREHLTLERG